MTMRDGIEIQAGVCRTHDREKSPAIIICTRRRFLLDLTAASDKLVSMKTSPKPSGCTRLPWNVEGTRWSLQVS